MALAGIKAVCVCVCGEVLLVVAVGRSCEVLCKQHLSDALDNASR